jgi:hypothetical protein
VTAKGVRGTFDPRRRRRGGLVCTPSATMAYPSLSTTVTQGKVMRPSRLHIMEIR